MCVANWHWSDKLLQVTNVGKGSIIYCSCKAHYTISVSTTVTCVRIQSSTYLVWAFLIIRTNICLSKKRVCMHVCVCTDSGAATLDGRLENNYHKWRNYIWSAQQILIYWSKSKYTEYTIVTFKFTISYEWPFWLCAPSDTNIAMPVVWKNTNSVSHLEIWPDRGNRN
jgi:hypothetical protein